MLPVNKEIYFNEKGWFPEHQVPLNIQVGEINELLTQQSKYHVIDSFTAFADSSGSLAEAYTTDGVHLSDAGYERWVELLRPHVRQRSADTDSGDQ